MELDHTFRCPGRKHVCPGLPSWCPWWPLCLRSPRPRAGPSCVLTTLRSTITSMRSVTSADLERQRPATSRQTNSVNFIETELTPPTMENKAEEVLRHGSDCQLLKDFTLNFNCHLRFAQSLLFLAACYRTLSSFSHLAQLSDHTRRMSIPDPKFLPSPLSNHPPCVCRLYRCFVHVGRP